MVRRQSSIIRVPLTRGVAATIGFAKCSRRWAGRQDARRCSLKRLGSRIGGLAPEADGRGRRRLRPPFALGRRAVRLDRRQAACLSVAGSRTTLVVLGDGWAFHARAWCLGRRAGKLTRPDADEGFPNPDAARPDSACRPPAEAWILSGTRLAELPRETFSDDASQRGRRRTT